MFHWRRAHLIALALVVGPTALVGGRAGAADKPAVSITLHSIWTTNRTAFPTADSDSERSDLNVRFLYTVVFQVTNSGPTPVYLESCGASITPTNYSGIFGMFGRCRVDPYTNCLMSFSWWPNCPAPYWFRYAVIKPASIATKVELAASRIKANIAGKANYKDFWPPQVWSQAYEVTSPVITKLPEPPWVAESLQPIPPKSSFEQLLDNFDWTTHKAKSRSEDHPK